MIKHGSLGPLEARVRRELEKESRRMVRRGESPLTEAEAEALRRAEALVAIEHKRKEERRDRFARRLRPVIKERGKEFLFVNMRKRIEQSGLRTEFLAKGLGIPRQRIPELLSGRAPWSLQLMRAFARELDCEIGDCFTPEELKVAAERAGREPTHSLKEETKRKREKNKSQRKTHPRTEYP